MFQSTRPRGARHSFYIIVYHILGFNPRARVGRDKVLLSQLYNVSSFNPRARVGRDINTNKITKTSSSFNPRARVGRDMLALLKRYAIL